jgi:LysM repeat protein
VDISDLELNSTIPIVDIIDVPDDVDIVTSEESTVATITPPKEEEEPVMTAIPPIFPEQEQPAPEPVHEYQPEPIVEEKGSDRSIAWLWLIIPIIIIILAFLFWPSNKVPEPIVKEPIQSETDVEKNKTELAEQLKSTEEPDLIKTPNNDLKTESKELLTTVKEPAPAKERSVSTENKTAPAKSKISAAGGRHSVQPGDNLWTIANDYYKQSYLWPNIYRANIDKVTNPDRLPVGDNVEIPSLQGKLGNLTEKDKKDIAEGFIEVYLVYKKMGVENANYYLWVVKKWQVPEIINKYRDEIDNSDLKIVDKIEGFPVVK